MSEALDLLLETALESVRPEEPNDEAFVAAVMAEVATTDVRGPGRIRRLMRRPTIIGISVAIVATGGAVAALVDTNSRAAPSPATRPDAPAATVSSADGANAAGEPKRASTKVDVQGPEAVASSEGSQATTDRSSSTLDESTGLLLRAEVDANGSRTDHPHRVTLTLVNTGKYPVMLSASKGCALQVMAYSNGSASALDTAVCAGMDGAKSWMLAPGEAQAAEAFVTLGHEGDWELTGVCRCSFRQIEPAADSAEGDGLSELGDDVDLSPSLSDQPAGQDLVAPPIRVHVL